MKKKLIKYMIKIERQYYKDNNIDILCLLKNIILQKMKLIYRIAYVTVFYQILLIIINLAYKLNIVFYFFY